MGAGMRSLTLPIVLTVATAILLLAATPAKGSHMTVWAGPGCNNAAVRYSACGCSSINLHGGYVFVYQGQTAAVYNQPNCQGVAHTRFSSDASGCDPFGWQSLFIQC